MRKAFKRNVRRICNVNQESKDIEETKTNQPTTSINKGENQFSENRLLAITAIIEGQTKK